MKTDAEVVEGAIKLIKSEGWIKHRFHNKNGYCMSGALIKSSDGVLSEEVRDAVIVSAGQVVGEIKWEAIPYINDNLLPDGRRGKRKAIKILKKAKKAL